MSKWTSAALSSGFLFNWSGFKSLNVKQSTDNQYAALFRSNSNPLCMAYRNIMLTIDNIFRIWVKLINSLLLTLLLVPTYIIINTCHTRFIPEWVAEAFQKLLRDTHVLPKIFSYEKYCRRDRW
jgi:hypothetical protein